MSEAMKYKLPPLPEQIFIPSGLGFTKDDIQAYAIAAIEAQGVPDGWHDLLKVIEWGAGGYNRFGDSESMCPYCENWQSDGHAYNCRLSAMLASAPPAPQAESVPPSDIETDCEPAAQGVQDGWKLVRTDALKMAVDFAVPAMERDRDSPSNSAWMVEAADRNINAVRAMLTSAQPAPQAEPAGACATCGALQDDQIIKQASVVQQEPVAWKHDCAVLLTNDVELWIDACPHCGKPRIQPAQQEPVAWICEEQTIGPNYGKKRLTFSKYYSDNPLHYKHTPLYTPPAQQAKPQPLSDEQIDLLMRSIGTTYADDNDERMRNHAEWQRMNHRQIVRAIEAAHGITKE